LKSDPRNSPPPEGLARSPVRQALAIAAALLLLNGALSFSTWWPTPGIVPDARLAPEFVLLWCGLLVLVAWRGLPSPRVTGWLAAGYLLLVLGRYIDVTAPALFGREVSLYWDGRQLPRFLWVTAQGIPWWLSVLAVAAVVALFWALHRGLHWGIRVAGRQAAPLALQRRWAIGLTAAALVLVIANYAGWRATWSFVSKPVIPTYWKQATLIATALSPRAVDRELPGAPALDQAMRAPAGQALAALAGRDVYLIFMESVGAVTYDQPDAAGALRHTHQRFVQDLRDGGLDVVSAFWRAPTFGGASDLSHLSLLSGIDLSDPHRHDLLLTTQRPTLLTLFKAQGYEIHGLYPAVAWEWPERSFYGFDQYEERRTLGYRGPSLGYWHVPDQFALARYEQKHPRQPGTPPRLLFFPTITCHFPFSPVPPYEEDWSRVLSDEPFDPQALQRALAEKVDWVNMLPAYVRMVDYTYRVLGGFMRQPEPRETVYVLIGDHQPTANISGEGAPWDVPVHIVSRDPALLQRLAPFGFAPGMNPPRPPLGGLHDLTAVLLRVFSAQPLHAGGLPSAAAQR
jgi:hypothetical protein